MGMLSSIWCVRIAENLGRWLARVEVLPLVLVGGVSVLYRAHPVVR